ncbi:hypothetical protein GO730_35835 [Spirosoma sp. HMF3257]|uniref:Uncharacterized protein n=1 Tax=Spirosoma telluris TaxID=2183553 RepID=A0A327NVT3_9BACT|nr:hypothetical protein [Spirosoma telluris]RAI78116.1 hypothetical protein HMF3257_35750 [Spirosoma telluris]
MPNIRMIPECYADTALVKVIVNERKPVDHVFGIPNVANEMKQGLVNQPDFILVGFVDNDKRTPSYFDDFVTITVENKVIFKKKRFVEHYLLVIDKAIETFLIWNAQQVDINLAEYGFTSNLKRLCQLMKRTTIGSDPNYLQLLSDLHTRQAPGFQTLERILNDLITT